MLLSLIHECLFIIMTITLNDDSIFVVFEIVLDKVCLTFKTFILCRSWICLDLACGMFGIITLTRKSLKLCHM